MDTNKYKRELLRLAGLSAAAYTPVFVGDKIPADRVSSTVHPTTVGSYVLDASTPRADVALVESCPIFRPTLEWVRETWNEVLAFARLKLNTGGMLIFNKRLQGQHVYDLHGKEHSMLGDLEALGLENSGNHLLFTKK